MSRKFAFISRHAPTEQQIALATDQGIELVLIGDLDAFTVTAKDVVAACSDYCIDGVIVVHPAAALRLQYSFKIGIFENALRAEEGQKPTFEAKSLHVFPLIFTE